LLSYLLRIRFRIDTFQIGATHLWQWGQCAGMFTLGVLLARPGLDAVDHRSLRLCRVGLGAGLVAVLALLAAYSSDLDPFGGGPGWQSALLATVEGVVCVSGTVVALDAIRRRPHPLIQRLSRPSDGAYVAQAPVIVGIALCLRNVPLPPAAKLILLLPASVTSCYMLAAAAHHARAVRRRDPRPGTATPKPVTGRAHRPDT
jgi:glucan biosynthesis protein C